MDQKIIDNANKYKSLAGELRDMKTEQSFDDGIPEDVQAALIRLYYAKAFEIEIEKCEDLLDEDTDMETVNAVTEAADAIEAASKSAFGAVEAYVLKDDEFAKRIEGITLSTETEGIFGVLIKLYKCEEIIRNAYKSSMKFPLYGSLAYSQWHKEEDAVVMDAEEEIKQKLGVDIYELLEVRQNLVREISGAIERKATS
jgi:hypothetical protein